MTNTTLSEESPHGVFGYGSLIDNGWHLLCAFSIVAFYMTFCGECLNCLERSTYGTAYHLMLQRIYREIMMVGLAAFGYTILNSTKADLAGGMYLAFGYADVCSFIMAVFFCLQGLFIMLGSLHQSRVWSLAAEISSHDLQKQIAAVEKQQPMLWRCILLPFCDVREQAEFRIIQSIFSSTYNISTRSQEFDFGMFLRMSHEANILSIIEIRPEKWVIIILVTLLPALKIELYESMCTSTRCEVQEEIFILIILGFVNTVLSLILLVCGRISELRLLSKAGPQSVADYSVFLKVEEKTRHLMAKKSVHSSAVKAAITEYITEAENMKESKRLKRRINTRRSTESAKLMTKSLLSRPRVSPLSTLGSVKESPQKREMLTQSSGVTDRVAMEMSPKCGDMTVQTIDNVEDHVLEISPESEATETIQQVPSPIKDVYTPAPYPRIRRSSIGQGFVIRVPSAEDVSEGALGESGGLIEENKVSERSHQPFVSQAVQTLSESTTNEMVPIRMSGGAVATRFSGSGAGWNPLRQSAGNRAPKPILSSHPVDKKNSESSSQRRASGLLSLIGGGQGKEPGPRVRKMSKKMSKARQSFMSRMSGLTRMREGKSDFKELLKKNSGKIIFDDVFLFGMPQLYFGLMSVVITCNSLYLAWWVTNFLMFILKLKSSSDAVMLIILSALPPLLTFPFLYLAIKASSVLKALSQLDLDIVSAVVEKTESNAATKRFFRELCMNLVKDSPHPKVALNNLFEEYSVDGITLHWDEFQSLVINSNIHLTQQKLRYLYGVLCKSKSKYITAKDFEAFVFRDPHEVSVYEKSAPVDTSVYLDSCEQNEAALRILDFLDPKVQLGISLVVQDQNVDVIDRQA